MVQENVRTPEQAKIVLLNMPEMFEANGKKGSATIDEDK